MQRTSRGKVVGAVVGALLLLADAAAAHHLWFDVSLSNYSAGAYADVSFAIGLGSTVPPSLDLDFPAGWEFAHQTGTSPLTPTPSDEEQIGAGSVAARWQPLCLASTLSLVVRWEDTMGPAAPANAVAHYTITGAGLFELDAWLLRTGPADYELLVPDLADELVCPSTTNHAWTLTLFGTTADGDKVVRNPSTPGTYTFTFTVSDSTGTVHTATDSVPIV